MKLLRSAVMAVPLLLALAACGGREGADEDDGGATGTLAGRIEADGSSTVQPFTAAAAERFRSREPDVRVTVGSSGTGGGFERFCAGETDLSNASRPITDEERAVCEKKGIDYAELHVANDALTVVVNKDNSWAECLTVAQLKRIWQPGSRIRNWRQIDPKFPDEELSLAGPGTDSGTFDYFTDEIVGEEGASRTDYQASENDNVIVQAVAGERGGLGYFGLSYYEQNQDKLKALAVDGGGGCVAPSVETAQSGEYKPLARPLFIYVKNESLSRPEVEAFLDYVLDNEREIAQAAQFVPLTDEQLEEAKDALAQAEGGG
jgi:phosphate transport system substrate-binding protein